jgi:hypothetical protein
MLSIVARAAWKAGPSIPMACLVLMAVLISPMAQEKRTETG